MTNTSLSGNTTTKSLSLSLNDEIDDIIRRHLVVDEYSDDGVITGYTTAVYSIMEAIEKRIDELKKECNGMPDYIDAYNKVKELLLEE